MIRISILTGLLALTACLPAAVPSPQKTPQSELSEAVISAIDAMPAMDLPMPLPSGTVPAIRASDLEARIAALADDRFEGRAPGSDIGELAADWIALELARVGARPAGENASWFQTVDMIEQTLDEAASFIKFTTPNGNFIVPQLGDDVTLWTKRQDALQLNFADSELVFVGYGVVAPEYGWDDYAGLDVRGKTVVMLVNDPGFAREDALFNGTAMTYYGRWTYKFEEAARQGATGAILIHETVPASYGWEVVQNSWSGAQADLIRADGGASRTLFESWISVDTARTLFRAAGLDFEAQKKAARETGFTAIPLPGVTTTGRILQSVDTKSSRNVIGTLKGQTRPDEYVLVTAHWDHLGKKTGEKTGEPTQDFYRDDIFNGAVDNATGIAGMLEMAEAMKADSLDRSVLFLAVTLEESGLLGSAHYAEDPTVPMNQIVAGINIDALQPLGPTHDMVVIGYGASELEDRLGAVLERQDRVIAPDPSPQAGSFYRSDHASFTKKGVPMLYAKHGTDVRDGGVAAGKAFAAAYTAQRYHKPMDEFDRNWDLSGITENIEALYQLTLGLAQSDDWPSWYPGNEFEAIRQASLAEKEGQ